MVDMKTDMAGSAAVLGALQVVAELAPPFPVHGYLGAAENMPSGHGVPAGRHPRLAAGEDGGGHQHRRRGASGAGRRPGLRGGAEPGGAHRPGDADRRVRGGARALRRRALREHRRAGGRAARGGGARRRGVLAACRWCDLQKETLRSDVADMKNHGERWGGAINAAIFLREFVGEHARGCTWTSPGRRWLRASAATRARAPPASACERSEHSWKHGRAAGGSAAGRSARRLERILVVSLSEPRPAPAGRLDEPLARGGPAEADTIDPGERPDEGVEAVDLEGEGAAPAELVGP